MKDETQTLSKTACPERKDRTPAAPVPGKSESALDGKKRRREEEKKPAWKTPPDSTAEPSDEKRKRKQRERRGETPTAMSPHAKEASGGKGPPFDATPSLPPPQEALKRTQS